MPAAAPAERPELGGGVGVLGDEDAAASAAEDATGTPVNEASDVVEASDDTKELVDSVEVVGICHRNISL